VSGFVAQPGVDVSGGDLPEISQRLDVLGKRKGVTIYAISGYRTPLRSVQVGGFPNDPHTKHQAEDIGVNSLLRSSASQLSDADLASVGLERPFSSAQEINHIQLSGGGPSLGDLAKGALTILSPGTAAAGALGGAAAGGAKDAATGAAKDAVSAIWGAVGADGARALLYVLLVLGGVALAVVGIARATGVGEHVKTAAGNAAKVAALA
jgi:hypothetical protein